MNNNVLKIQVVCPVYNEENMVVHFYEKLKYVLDSISNIAWKVLFVMDRSTDQTSKVLTELSNKNNNVQVIMLSTRFGHQMSLVAGIDHTDKDSDAIIMMDADLQHPPELIPRLIDEFRNGHEVVYTIRSEPKDNNVLKKISSNLFYKVMNILSEVKISSGEADFRLISNRVANIFKTDIRERNQFLRGLFSWVGFERIGISYDPAEREIGTSKYNWTRMFRFAFSGIVSFSKKPLQYAIISGIAFSLFGLLFTCIVIANYFLNDKTPSGWSTLSILICVFGGIQLFFLGILGEYIAAIFDEVKSRPLYIVEKKINV